MDRKNLELGDNIFKKCVKTNGAKIKKKVAKLTFFGVAWCVLAGMANHPIGLF